MRKISFIMLSILACHVFSHEAIASTTKKHHKKKQTAVKKSPVSIVDPKPLNSALAVDAKPQSPWTGSLNFTSNYIYRGISNSNNTPAVQGSLTYTFLTTGIYLNIWGSNVNLTAPDGSTATFELDTVAGITNSIGDNFNYNLSLQRYNYPKSTQLNYLEFIGNVSYYFLTGLIGYSANVYNVHAPGTYYNLGVKFGLPCQYVYLQDINFAAAVGHYSLPRAAGNSYNDYAVTLTKKFNDTYNFSLAWTDTNHRFYDTSLDQSHIVATVTANF